MSKPMQHIDAIAREKNRDVLFVHFENYVHAEAQAIDSVRQQVLAWLEANEIPFSPCMGLEEEQLLTSYNGDIYIDIPFDSRDHHFNLLSDYLEDEQGNMKIDGVLFFVLSLELALQLESERAPDVGPLH